MPVNAYQMKYCKRCVMPDTRPGLAIDQEGVCNACRWHEKKATIDWTKKLSELHEIAAWAKRTSYSPWHCVVGVSGGKDSTWQAMFVRDELKLNPLLVQYSCSDATELGRKNLENLVNLGFSLVSYHPRPETARRLSKRSFYKFGNVVKYSEMALFPIPYRVAMAHEIPLVFFGENPALECGDTNARGEGWDATTIRYNNTLAGANLDVWLGDGIERKDLLPYSFPAEEEFAEWGGRGIFMGYYLNWYGFRNAVYAIQHGLHCIKAPPTEIGDPYRHNSIDFMFISVNSMLKHIKLGFGNATEFLSYDVRNGRVSREEAIALIRELDGQCHPRYIEEYCNWIGISVEEFWRVANGFRGKMWEKNSAGEWSLIEPIWVQEPSRKDIAVERVLERIDSERAARSDTQEALYHLSQSGL